MMLASSIQAVMAQRLIRVLCPKCRSRAISWVQASGKGKLHSFGIGHQSFNKAFKVPAPYVLCIGEVKQRKGYATSLPAFLRARPPKGSPAFLADLAMLEWTALESLQAERLPPLDLPVDSLSILLEDRTR